MRERPEGSGRWQLRVHVGGRQYTTATFTGSAREARKALARLEVAADQRKAPKPSRQTVGALLEDWWTMKAWDSVGARRQAREDLDRYLIPHLGDIQLTKLTDKPIALLYRGLQTPGPSCLSKSGRPLGPATVRRLHVNLHSALNWAVKKGRLGRNPASIVDVPANPPTKVRGPDQGELRKLLATAGEGDADFATFVRVAAATGRRREDVLGLTVADLRTEESAIVFDKRAVLGGPDVGLVIELLDKNGRAARVDIDAVTMAAVTATVERLRARAATVAAVLPKSAHIFTDDILGAQPWRPDSTSRKFRVLRDAAGLPGITLHGLRHSHITELLEAGLNVEAVALRVGDDPMTIYNVYAHARRTSDRRAAAIMDSVLNGGTRRLTSVESV